MANVNFTGLILSISEFKEKFNLPARSAVKMNANNKPFILYKNEGKDKFCNFGPSVVLNQEDKDFNPEYWQFNEYINVDETTGEETNEFMVTQPKVLCYF